MRRCIATLAAAGLVALAACGGNGEETGTDGGLETHPPGGPTADTAGVGAGAMGGDTAVPPAAGH